MNRSLATMTNAAAPMTFEQMMDHAKVLLESGFLPAQVKTPAQAVAIMLTGQELGIPAMRSLRQIIVIQGKPSISPELMAGLVESAYGVNALIVTESSDTSCTVSCHKPGWDKRYEVTFTIDDAKRAGIYRDNWMKYPKAMLRSRAISLAAKTYFQAAIGGLYTHEELGGSPMDDDAHYIDAHVTEVPSTTNHPTAQPTPRSSDSGAREIPVSMSDGVIIDAVTGEETPFHETTTIDTETGEVRSSIVTPDDSFVNQFLIALDDAADYDAYKSTVAEISGTPIETNRAILDAIDYHDVVWKGVAKINSAKSAEEVDRIEERAKKLGMVDERFEKAIIAWHAAHEAA